MTQFQLTATWSFASSFHMGTGLSGAGADRTVRAGFRSREEDEDEDEARGIDAANVPEISGEALKGAIRGSAERIVRWLIHPETLEEEEDNSWPRHPALRRIFAWQQSGGTGKHPPAYRFSPPRYIEGGSLGAMASTAINPERGTAEEKTLRVMQHWSANAFFAITISGRGGNWDDAASRDYLDLVLLAAAFVATAQVGGKKGNGLGETAVADWNLSPVPRPDLNAAALEKLRASLLEEMKTNG